MISTALLSWLGSDQNLMLLMSQNWIWGITLVATMIFCETGLVVLPFLPGDSLFFATGAFLGMSAISPLVSILVITLAAVAGDAANFAIGRSRVGQYLLKRAWIKPHHLIKTSAYFDRFGGPTVTIGRFVPVVRTIAPFMAGLSGMSPRRFAIFNVMGALVWCGSLIMAGFWLGQVPWIKGHMTWISIGIVAMSMIPVVTHLPPRFKKVQG
jgi:membrane-associated protein